MGKKIIRFFAYLLTAALFLVGVIIFVYPLLSGYMSEQNAAEYIKNFENLKESLTENNQSDINGENHLPSSANGEHQKPSSEKKNQTFSEISKGYLNSETLEKLHKEMQRYNTEIYENRQEGLCDAWSYEQSAISLSEFGLNSGAVGVLKVPKMGIEMPIFLGASRNNMSRGAAQLGQTSIPIGGNNTNCVLAGHRGWSGARYFLDIELMQRGDMVYIENFWETLCYQVTDIKVIYPDDIKELLIQEDKDMVTLFTCHPYWASTYRYAVFCERVYGVDIPGQSSEAQMNTNSAVPEGTDNVAEGSQDADSVIEVDQTSQTRIFIERFSYVAIPVLLIALSIVLAVIRRKGK